MAGRGGELNLEGGEGGGGEVRKRRLNGVNGAIVCMVASLLVCLHAAWCADVYRVARTCSQLSGSAAGCERENPRFDGGIACPACSTGSRSFKKQMTDPLLLRRKIVWKCNAFFVCFLKRRRRRKRVFYEEIQVSTISAVKKGEKDQDCYFSQFFPPFVEDTKEKTRQI